MSHARCALVLLVALGMASLGSAQQPGPPELAPPLGLSADDTEPDAKQAEGAIAGAVFSNADAKPELGVEATLFDASGKALGTALTDAQGRYRFDRVPAGTYGIRFAKPGFRTARLTELAVVANQDNPGDFALAPESKGESGVEEIVITAQSKAPVADRANVDELVNTMDALEIGKFAASDIGDAVRRMPGVNVVEGQFAIIRGLEDRYSSTLYNSAPVPSPDPNSQSVQLDLFPSEIASNLVVSKTFASNLPSNSSGGAINIITHAYPETLQIKLSGGSGYNANAIDRYLRWNANDPIGTPRKGAAATEGEGGLLIAGTTSLFERELTLRGVFNWELDYQTKFGEVEAREPQAAQLNPIFPFPASGGVSTGVLGLSSGRFDFTESEKVTQQTGFLDLGYDLDADGKHHVDFTLFYSKKADEVVQLRQDGFLPGFDYAAIAAQPANGDPTPAPRGGTIGITRSAWIARSWREDPPDSAIRGSLWSSSFNESRAFARTRDLSVFQLNGEHELSLLEGLKLSWAANHAETNQDEGFYATRYWYEPPDPNQIPTELPVTLESLPPGGTYYAGVAIFRNANDVTERQNFFRFDLAYEREVSRWLTLSLSGGLWWERSSRDVGSSYLQTPTAVGGSTNLAIPSSDLAGLAAAIDGGLLKRSDGEFQGTFETGSAASRRLLAGDVQLKATFWEQLDVLAGVRHEAIDIASSNDPFTGEFLPDGTPRIFPSAFLMFDRFDTPGRSPELALPPGSVFNDQILNIDVAADPLTGRVNLTTRAQIEALVNGRIAERRNLPSVAIHWRPADGLAIRAAYSRTVARPSFRELGYYVTVETGSDDLVIGNPQLALSDVESWDARVEYTWGDFGDLAALSAFTKKIDEPIESIVIRDPTNAEISSGTYRSFFNNPNQADLWGVEVEGRKALDFFGVDGLEYLSLAANFTYISAEVGRSRFEIAQAAPFVGTLPGVPAEFDGLSRKRRLFSQPEWIANGDVTFDQPDWGTKLTLAVFAISDVLDTAGNAAVPPAGSGSVYQLSLDRYVDAYYQVDLVGSQKLPFSKMPGEWTVKVSVKNLTDSTRRLIYDTQQTIRKYAERTFQVGRDYSFSLTYDYRF